MDSLGALNGSLKWGLKFTKEVQGKGIVIGYVDASYVGNMDIKIYLSGVCIYVALNDYKFEIKSIIYSRFIYYWSLIYITLDEGRFIYFLRFNVLCLCLFGLM